MKNKRIIKNKILKKWQKWNWFILECNNCHKDFFISWIMFRRWYWNYCSVSCSNKWERKWYKESTKHYNKWYVLVRSNDPRSNYRWFFYEHIIVAEKKYWRKIKKWEHVHHVNWVRNDNRSSNLVILTASEHQKLHHRKELNDVKCSNCWKEVRMWKYLKNKFKNRYCSRKCYIEHRFKKNKKYGE